ncbi:MAG TPA: hypothetical protein VGM56_12225 [Byssovorax sp.]
MKRALAISFALFLAACGGNVFVDDEGTSSGASTPPSCVSVCDKIDAACPNKTGSCSSTCATIDAIIASGRCTSEVAAFLSCVNDDPAGQCAFDDETCLAAQQAFTDCTGLL